MYKKGRACHEVDAISNAFSCSQRAAGGGGKGDVGRENTPVSSGAGRCEGVASCIDCEKVTRALITRAVKIRFSGEKAVRPNRA